MTAGAFDPLAILGVLHGRQVRFVVIGGIAGYLLGSDLLSANLDICFASDFENVRQLALALNDINARWGGSQRDTADDVHEHMLQRGGVFIFNTDCGVLHCVSNPAGTGGYDELHDHAECMEIDGMKTDIADLSDLIRMKEGSAREKDRLALVMLRALQKLRK